MEMVLVTICEIEHAEYHIHIVILFMLTITSSDITLQTSRCAHLALQSATEYRGWMLSIFIALEYGHLVEMDLVTICDAEHAFIVTVSMLTAT